MIARTHCGAGHRMAGDNLIVSPNGHRNCRECNRIRARAYYETGSGSWKSMQGRAQDLASTHPLGPWDRDTPYSYVTACTRCGALAAVDTRDHEINGGAVRRPCAA